MRGWPRPFLRSWQRAQARLGQTGRGELELSAWGGEAALGEGREAFRQPDSHEALGVETLERRPVRLRPRSAHRQLDQLAIRHLEHALVEAEPGRQKSRDLGVAPGLAKRRDGLLGEGDIVEAPGADGTGGLHISAGVVQGTACARRKKINQELLFPLYAVLAWMLPGRDLQPRRVPRDQFDTAAAGHPHYVRRDIGVAFMSLARRRTHGSCCWR